LPRRARDLVVGVDEGAAEPLRDGAPDRGLSGTAGPDEHQIPTRRERDVEDPWIDLPAQEERRLEARLRDEDLRARRGHEPAGAGGGGGRGGGGAGPAGRGGGRGGGGGGGGPRRHPPRARGAGARPRRRAWR